MSDLTDKDNEYLYYELAKTHSEEKLEQLFALKALKGNPAILKNPFAFEKLCYALNGVKANFNSVEPASILMIAKAVKYILDEVKDPDWNNEIKQYVAHVAHDEGWIKLPKLLSFAQAELDDVNVKIELDDEQKKIQGLKHEALERYLKL